SEPLCPRLDLFSGRWPGEGPQRDDQRASGNRGAQIKSAGRLFGRGIQAGGSRSAVETLITLQSAPEEIRHVAAPRCSSEAWDACYERVGLTEIGQPARRRAFASYERSSRKPIEQFALVAEHLLGVVGRPHHVAIEVVLWQAKLALRGAERE